MKWAYAITVILCYVSALVWCVHNLSRERTDALLDEPYLPCLTLLALLLCLTAGYGWVVRR